MSKGWIAVDLDGTLAHYDGWKAPHIIGAPIALMVNRVKQWLAEGRDVRIFTARVSGTDAENEYARLIIESWCSVYIGQKLPVTCTKDLAMTVLYDDRCVRVERNTGIIYMDPPL